MKKGQGRNTISMLGALCALTLIVATVSSRGKLEAVSPSAEQGASAEPAATALPSGLAPAADAVTATAGIAASSNTVLVSPVDVDTIAKAGIVEIETWIDALVTSDREQRLASAFGDSRPAKMLARMLVVSSAYKYSEEVSPLLERLQAAYADEFEKNREASASAVEAGLAALGASEFPLERAALLATLASVPGQAERARELALREATEWVPEARPKLSQEMSEEEKNRIASSTDARYQLPILAFRSFLDGATGFDDAARGARAALSAQVDSGVRSNIIAQIDEKFPARAGELRKLLGD